LSWNAISAVDRGSVAVRVPCACAEDAENSVAATTVAVDADIEKATRRESVRFICELFLLLGFVFSHRTGGNESSKTADA